MRAPSDAAFTSRLRSATVSARVGLWLGITFGICFVTGLISHYAQAPSQPVPFPTSPAWGYRVTQGLHIITGCAAVPLLLVKLWSVYPKLFELPPLRQGVRRLVLALAEKGSIAVLVASAIFQLASGLANVTEWYPFAFSFRATHYAFAWIAIGALVLHVAVKLPIIRDVLTRDVETDVADRSSAIAPGPISRRGLVRTAYVASGLAALSVAGNSVTPLGKISVFAPHSGDGPLGLPVTTSAAEAHVTAAATDPSYRLRVVLGDVVTEFTRAELLDLPQTTSELPIACVEGWSRSGTWSGVRLRDLLDEVGAQAGHPVYLLSVQPSGPFRGHELPAQFVDDPRTLLALRLNGESLSIDHGYPARLIAPNRPGVLQTKWVGQITVRA